MKLSEDEVLEIKSLRKAKKYDEIYYKYGREQYLKNTPRYRVLKARKKLIKEKRYLDVQTKFGDLWTSDHPYKVLYNDVILETGSKFKAVNKVGALKVKNVTKASASMIALAITVFVGACRLEGRIIPDYQKFQQREDLARYERDVDTYLANKDYSNSSDLEIFMDLMNDMWNTIDGYKYPENQSDIKNCERLYLYQNNYGVCRNYADDLAYRINEINPKYNARTVLVYLVQGSWKYSNMNFHYAPGYESQNGNNDNEENEFDKLIANHSVTFVDLKDKGITLVLDPTNCGVGVLIDGRIEMFNAISINDKQIAEELTCELSMFIQKDSFELIRLLIDKEESKHIDYTYQELEKMYGLDAQNETLDNINRSR